MRNRTSVVPIVVWFAAGITLLVTFDLIENPFVAMMVLPPAAFIYFGAAAMLLAGDTRHAIKERSTKSWTSAASIPALIAALVLIAPLITKLAVYAQFAAMLPAYTRIVEAMTKVPPPHGSSSKPADEIRYTVDNGPPVCVAFPKNGIIDNWWGIIYDPSDAVAQATGWNFETGKQEFTAPPEIRTLFGGDLVSCWRLYRHYYSCSFT